MAVSRARECQVMETENSIGLVDIRQPATVNGAGIGGKKNYHASKMYNNKKGR